MNKYIENFFQLSNIYANLLEVLAERQSKTGITDLLEPSSMAYVANLVLARIKDNPEQFYKDQLDLYLEYYKIWGNSLSRFMGKSAQALYDSGGKDRRFKDDAWDNTVLFNFLKQSYLCTVKWVHEQICKMHGIDDKTKEKYQLFASCFIDAFAPSNFVFTNPKVLREFIDTKGDNLVKGMKNLLEDLKNYGFIKTTDFSAFKLGENIAASKGEVVFQNDLMQLIQYHPVTKKTWQTPILLLPAWINKYYILDLSERNSLVGWLLKQGYTVFMVSWVNPDQSYANKSFEDYVLDGAIASIEQVQKITGQKQISVMGYCLGGTLLACTLAYLKAKGQEPVKAATFLTTMIDFSDAGVLHSLIDEKMVDKIDAVMKEKGYFDGTDMAVAFSIIRANDLIWSFVVNNYLLGKEPMPFDILYWNADSTRLPAQMHSFYLRNMYIKNVLAKKNSIKLLNVPIDMNIVDTPSYILSTIEDHISPWKTTYKTTQMFQGSCKFVLSSSGHVAGVVNPPKFSKYHYFTYDKNPKDPEMWFKHAQKHEGSWWTNWHEWHKKFCGKKVDAVLPGTKGGKLLEPAPGSYVRKMVYDAVQ